MGIHKDTGASVGSVAVHGYPGCDLYRRHVITPLIEQGAAENLCLSDRSTGKAGLSGKKGKVLSLQSLIFLEAVKWATNHKQGSWLHHFTTEVFNAYTCKRCHVMGMQGKSTRFMKD